MTRPAIDMALSSTARPTSGTVTFSSRSTSTTVCPPLGRIARAPEERTGAPPASMLSVPVREPSSAGPPQASVTVKDTPERTRRRAADGRDSAGTVPPAVAEKPSPSVVTWLVTVSEPRRATRPRWYSGSASIAATLAGSAG